MDLTALAAADVISCDCEASGLFVDDGARLSCVALAWDGGSLGIPVDQGVLDKLGGDQAQLWAEDNPNCTVTEWQELLRLLDTKQLVFHHAKYDLHMLATGTRHWGGKDLSERLHWDTMLAAKLLEPLQPASLDAAGQRAGLGGKAGLDEVQAWLRKRKLPKHRYDLVDWAVIQPYVTRDAELTLALYHAQEALKWVDSESVTGGVPAEYARELDLCRTLFQMERRGVGYDSQRSLAVAEALEHQADEIESAMPFKCDITAAKTYFFGEAGLSPDRVGKAGAGSLDDEQIRLWASQGVPWAAEYRSVKRRRKAVSMWYRGYPDKVGADGRLRTSYRQHTVVSGRLSVERVNLQAMPKADKLEGGEVGVRDLLTAKPGFGLWGLDMQQAELRAAARYANCGSMLEMLAAGSDIHAHHAIQILGADPAAADFKLRRDIGKKLTFSSLFHISGPGFQRQLAREADIILTETEAWQLVDGWRRRYPEFSWAYKRAERRVLADGYARILPGTEYETKSWFRPYDHPWAAWNRMVQGSLAAWLRLWLVEIERTMPGALVLTVHDSVLLELPVEMGGEIIANNIAAAACERASELFDTPMPVEVEKYV